MRRPRADVTQRPEAKDAGAELLVQAVHAAAGGEALIAPSVTFQTVEGKAVPFQGCRLPQFSARVSGRAEHPFARSSRVSGPTDRL